MDWQKWKSLKLREKIDIDGFSIKDFLSKLKEIRNSTFVFFDTETTGFKPEYDQITQIAAVSVDFENGKIVERDFINLYALLNPDIEKRLEKDMESGEYRSWLKRLEPNFIKIERDPSLSPEQKNARIEMLKDPKAVLRMTGYIKQKGYVFNSIDDLSSFISDPENRDVEDFLKDYSIGDDEQAFSLHGTATDKTMEEKKMLENFYSFVVTKDKPILVAHNSDFDMNMVNGRNKVYGISPLIEGGNIQDVLDTLQIATKYKEALQFLLKRYESELKSLDTEEINSLFSQSKAKMPLPTDLGEASFVSKSKTHDIEEPENPSANIPKLSNDVISAVNKMPQEQREKALQGIKLNTLVRSLKNTLNVVENPTNRFSRKLGDLASRMKQSPEGWHDALADVRMLIGVYNNMYQTIKMANEYEEGGARVVESMIDCSSLMLEMEPYQQMVTQKHPSAKKRLTGHGNNKDKSSPYKIKLSYKRGKSAPPIG